MAIKKFTLTVFVIAVFFLYCNIEVIDSEQQSSPCRSDHFIVYYDTDRITLVEMELIVYKKELLLNHINSYLNTDYNGVIEVYLTDNITASHACDDELIYETYWYVIDDKGHEIAQVVSIRSWGKSGSPFMREGIAVACELHNNQTAVDIFRKDLREALKTSPMDSIMARMKMDIIDYQFFEYTRFEYERAGAFLHYLKSLYGIASVKKIYQSSIALENVEQSFVTIFNRSLDSLISDFSHFLLEQ